ncbi:Replication factor A protein 2 [Tilletia horrida]|uniref:Replication factor A protein 2 n=1 Tax=Tilletia horrida TaxID=155126 RepID=A0AAN6JKY2_9BASI|nr:Replication factor A protein 2 [Tilletia horrida]KAK0533796.1 Replication factor A protein 2 [Tilletia horrida]KAK0534746.1 Replication factor A protein 2 [Tilletia horrida]KAK0562424.1 Replication factor A protein 2 [Tilletia horrida]
MSGYDDTSNPYYGGGGSGGGGGGGGFMTGNYTNDSPSGGAKKAANNSLRPVTIRQILTADQPHADADFCLDGADLGQLTFVAVVRNVSRNATNVSYSVEDGTGTIEVRQWLDSQSDDSEKATEISQNTYVRILGTVKSFQSKRSISVGHIRPVEDFNEIFFHKLEAAYVHLQLTRGSGGQQQGFKGNATSASDYSMGNLGGANSSGGAAFPDLSSPLQRKIMEALMSLVPGAGDDGVHVGQIKRKVTQGASNYSDDQITDAIEELQNEGYLYQSANEDHVLPTTT